VNAASRYLYHNQLTGTLPTELGALTDLTYLWIYNNHLTGTLPSQLGILTRLTRMELGINRLTGTLPTELGALTNIKWMHVYDNQLTGTVPTELGGLTSLTYTGLYDNQLTGTLPSELGALTNLAYMLVCNNTGLCGDIPAGVTPGTYSTWCLSVTGGTLLGSECPTLPPTGSPSTASQAITIPTSSPKGEQPLKDNWFRKRDLAREQAFPQKFSWFRKQAKQEATD